MIEAPRNRPAPLTLLELSQRLGKGTITSRALVEQALAEIRDPNGEGSRAFLAVHADEALAAADLVDARRRSGAKLPWLAGVPISIKDLFDEAGKTTLGGSKILVGTPAAARDCVVVERLRHAGAVIIGRTNMTEFAYSGLGINPHYGTPKNTWDRATGRIPGGSSSGAAISVADGMAAAAIGTDTGGSVRIPAALNGLVGFKPTARRVPLDGVLPLSFSLDSVGPIARSVNDCALLDAVLADERGTPPPVALRELRLAVPTSMVQADLSADVAGAFAAALTRLSEAGVKLVELSMKEFELAAEFGRPNVLSSAQAFWWHRPFLQHAAAYDPRVLVRIRPGELVDAAAYIDMLRLRERFVRAVASAVTGYDALLMPTTPDVAPPIADVVASDENYVRWNGRMLRNTSLVNLFDGCALSLPCHQEGAAPVGLMVAGPANADRQVLAVGLALERIVRSH